MGSGKTKQVECHSLGIEGGGTRTSVVALDSGGRSIQEFELGPGNLQLFKGDELGLFFDEIARASGRIRSVGVGMAGLRTDADRRRVRDELARVWPDARAYITDDLETVLAGAPEPEVKSYLRVLLVSGTGSCVFARDAAGREHKVGGWGQQLGDEAGAFGIGQSAIRRLLRDYDYNGKASGLLKQVLEQLDLKHPDDLNTWSATATKSEFASVAPLIFKASRRKSSLAGGVVEQAAERIAKDAVACCRRFKRVPKVQFILSGGCFQKQAAFAALVEKLLRERVKGCEVVLAAALGARGAAALGSTLGKRLAKKKSAAKSGKSDLARWVPRSLAMSPTEERHPDSMDLDRLPIREAIELMAREDGRIPNAILKEAPKIEAVIRWVSRSLKNGGRLLYFGAGTSGRLGVLDASECPPTFRSEPHLVQGVIAGGRTALWRSVEGAEDSVEEGAAEAHRLNVTADDVVIGIAASGRTPFVWGSIAAARSVGAKTALICFNPHLELNAKTRPNKVICPNIGPEILTGSTRLKSGTATKMILNMITTLAMVRCGKVLQNLMIDLNPSNVKLRDRAQRILIELTQCSADEAREALERESWVVKAAYQRLQNSARRRAKRN